MKGNSTAEVVWRAKDASTKARLALVFADKPGEVVTLSLGAASTDGWKDSLVDLSDFQGRTIATMGLQVEGSGDVQVNVGKLAVSDESSTPAIPAGFRIDELTTDGEMNVSWQKADFASVDSYILEAVDASGNVHHLAQAYGDSRYVKKVDLEGSYMQPRRMQTVTSLKQRLRGRSNCPGRHLLRGHPLDTRFVLKLCTRVRITPTTDTPNTRSVQKILRYLCLLPRKG